MPDPMDQNNPPSTPPPTLPDPQALVDAALSPAVAASPQPVGGVSSTGDVAEGQVGTAKLGGDSPMEPLPSVPPAPEPIAPPTLPPTPTPIPTPATTSVAMGDDTPLAFVTPPPSSTTTTTTTTTQPVDGAAPLPPVPPAPTGPEMPKKKGKAGKIVGLLLGFLTLLGVGGGGAYWYYYDFRTIPTIASVDRGEDQCSGCDGGHQLVWRNGECVWRARLCEGEDDGSGGSSGPTNGVNNSGVTNRADCDGCGTDGYAWVWRNGACKKGNTKCDVSGGNYVPPQPEEVAPSANNTCGTGYTYCGGAIDKCISHGALSEAGGGCNKYGEVVYGIATVYGANPGRTSCDPAKVSAQLATECQCGGTTYCFDRRGTCHSDIVNRLDGSQVDTGFCGVAGSYINGSFVEYPGLFNEDGSLKYDYFCDLNGCSTTDSACAIVRYTCSGTSGTNSCVQNEEVLGNSGTFRGSCGKVEQIDVMCGGYKMSRTRINPPCVEGEDNPPASEPPASAPPTAPVMACTGLTYTPTTAPVIGSVLTFTCAGSITPTTAGTLSYKFRSSINNAAPTPLANTTPTTARLTIAACGSYKVECQACATLNGVLTCDPIWTGATQ